MGLIGVASAAVAQTGTNIRGRESSAPVSYLGSKSERQTSAVSKARETMRKFAQCVVKNSRRRPQAAEVVLDDIPNSLIVKKYSRLINPDCLDYGTADGMALRLPADFFRYAMAEALLHAEFPRPMTDFKLVPPLRQRTHDPSMFLPESGKKLSKRQLEDLENARLADLAEIFVSKYGECVARMDPINSHSLVFTKPSSADEARIIGLLAPSLASCLEPGRKVTINKSMVRGTIAVNYYRLVRSFGSNAQQVTSQ